MPKVTLTFDLPHEDYEYRLTHQADDMASIIAHFTNLVRDKTKYSPETEAELWEPVREAWWNLLNEYNYDPYEG